MNHTSDNQTTGTVYDGLLETVEQLSVSMKSADKALDKLIAEKFAIAAKYEELKKLNTIHCEHAFKSDSFLANSLDRFEAIWDRVFIAKDLPEDVISENEMQQYIVAAKHLAGYGRVVNYVFSVEEKMKELDEEHALKRRQLNLTV